MISRIEEKRQSNDPSAKSVWKWIFLHAFYIVRSYCFYLKIIIIDIVIDIVVFIFWPVILIITIVVVVVIIIKLRQR